MSLKTAKLANRTKTLAIFILRRLQHNHVDIFKQSCAAECSLPNGFTHQISVQRANAHPRHNITDPLLPICLLHSTRLRYIITSLLISRFFSSIPRFPSEYTIYSASFFWFSRVFFIWCIGTCSFSVPCITPVSITSPAFRDVITSNARLSDYRFDHGRSTFHVTTPDELFTRKKTSHPFFSVKLNLNQFCYRCVTSAYSVRRTFDDVTTEWRHEGSAKKTAAKTVEQASPTKFRRSEKNRRRLFH